MIKLLQTSIPSATRLFENARARTFFFADVAPFINAQITVNIPNSARILILLAEKTNSLQELERAFLALKATCELLKHQIQNYLDEINKIINQIEKVNNTFGSFDVILNQLLRLIPIFNTIIAAGQITLSAQVFPVANGALIIKTGDAINFLKGKIKEIQSLALIVNGVSKFFTTSTSEILAILVPARNELVRILTILNARCLFIDSVYLRELKNFNLNSTSNNSQNNEEIVDTLGNIYKPEVILDNLENSNKSLFIEYLRESGHTGYQITKG